VVGGKTSKIDDVVNQEISTSKSLKTLIFYLNEFPLAEEQDVNLCTFLKNVSILVICLC
jgi:hypothetical protein